MNTGQKNPLWAARMLTWNLIPQVTDVCQEMKESMYTVYEDNSTEMHVKLEELSKVLESCTRLHQELVEATQALSGLRVGISINKQEWWCGGPPRPQTPDCSLHVSSWAPPLLFYSSFPVKMQILLQFMCSQWWCGPFKSNVKKKNVTVVLYC